MQGARRLQQQSRRPAKKRGCWEEVPLGRWPADVRNVGSHLVFSTLSMPSFPGSI